MGDVRNLGGEKGTKKEKERGEGTGGGDTEGSKSVSRGQVFFFWGQKFGFCVFLSSAFEMTKLPIWLC